MSIPTFNEVYEKIPDRYTAWYGWDTENDDKGVVTLSALIREDGEKSVWKKAGGFKQWCLDSDGKPVVICHNLEYDLVNEFKEEYPYLQLNYLKGNLISAKFGNVSFLDSFNHFRMSLANLGKALGLQKGNFDIYSEDYVCMDAWICLQAMVKARDYIASIGGIIGATAGSSAVSVWKRMTDSEFCTGAIDSPWLRKAYYGGRVELFQVKATGIVRGYDINSMYPYAMMNEYPEYLQEDKSFSKAKGIAEVTISIPIDKFVAPLPYREDEQRLLYPVGMFRGVWSYDEIRYAESVGGVIHTVHKAVGCNTMVRPFNDYVEKLYAKRKASTDESERLFLKVLMNALYGKMAARSTVTRMVSRHTMMERNDKRMHEVKWIDQNRGMLDYTTPSQDYVNVGWGSMITSYSRILLAKYMASVPPEKLIYSDTDSIYCVDFEIPTSPELGGMKLEMTGSNMVVLQPKVYQFDNEYKAKGVPKPKRDEAGNIVIDYAKNYMENGGAEFMLPIRFRASINSKRGVANQWIKQKRTMKTKYAKKRLSGNRYFPPIIEKQTELFADSAITGNKQTKTKQNK